MTETVVGTSMGTRRYIQFTNLSDWDDDSIVVVHVQQNGMARVRIRSRNETSDELPLGEALEEARLSLNLPILEQVAVYLEDGAVWDERYGELVPHKT